jgi:hypothetical protein
MWQEPSIPIKGLCITILGLRHKWDIVCGAILASEEKCDLAWVKAFIESAFGVEVSDSTITRRLADNRLTLQMVGLHPIPKGMM